MLHEIFETPLLREVRILFPLLIDIEKCKVVAARAEKVFLDVVSVQLFFSRAVEN
jgi:hypothetical protein